MSSSDYSVSSPPQSVTTEDGPDAAIAELREIVNGDSRMYPDADHSAEFHRQQLRGEKNMPVQTFDAFLARVAKRKGREAVRRIFDRWLSKFAMAAIDLAEVEARLKPANLELLDAAVVTSQLIDTFNSAISDGVIDDKERQQIKTAADAVRSEIRDLEMAR